MANVKITELTELSAIDVADNDVVPIVDVGGDTTKKITIESLKSATAAANDFITFTQLNANINVVQDNVAAIAVGTASDTETRLNANLDVVQANVASTDTRLDANITLLTNEDTALQARIAVNTLVAASNDFITFTQLNANINLVQDNVASISVDTASGTEARLNANLDIVQDNVASIDANVVSIVDTGGHTVTFSANLIPSVDGTYDLGSSSAKWKDLYLTGNSIKLGGITISDLGGEGISITGTSGEQANVVTPQLGGAANVSANIATLEANVASTDTRLGANITLLTNEDTALQARLDTNVTAFTNEDTALQARLDTNVTTFTNEDTALQARLDTNVTAFTNEDTALQARLDTNVTAFTNEDTALQARLDTNVTAFTNEDTALQARIDANALVAASNEFLTFTQLNANINLVQDNVASISVDTAAGTEARLNANLDIVQDNVASLTTTSANEDTALQSRLTTNVTAFTNEDIALQARIDANALVAASNDFITFTQLNANVDIVQDNVAQNVTDITALETRRTANIAGAVSSITTSDLTASRALVSDGSGKVDVSAVTATELGHLDGVSGAIQTQLDAKAALAGATFTGQVNMSDDLVVTGNLIVNGGTTTANSVNLVVEDRLIMLANSVSGAPCADVGILFNRGNQGNAALFYDESATTFKLSDTQDPASNTAISPVSASNLDVGILTAVTINQNGANLDDLISSNVDGAISTVNDTDLTASRALVSSGSGKIEVSAVTATEVGYLDGVSSAIQTQLNAKQATITGAATTIDDADLTASRALVSDGSGKVAVSAVTATEIGYLDGVSSAIQTQLDAKSSTANAEALAAGIASVGVADGYITTAKLAADAVTGAKIADDAINSEHYTDGSIDRVHLAADIIDGTKIANDVLNSEHYVAGSIDAEHIASSAVTTAKINDNAVTVGKLATTLDLGALS